MPAHGCTGFTVERSGNLTALVAQGRYRIIDFGREGWNASFTPTGGSEGIPLAPFKGGPFHANSKHAAARCQLHFHALSSPAASGPVP